MSRALITLAQAPIAAPHRSLDIGSYTEMSQTGWASGFVVLTFADQLRSSEISTLWRSFPILTRDMLRRLQPSA